MIAIYLGRLRRTCSASSCQVLHIHTNKDPSVFIMKLKIVCIFLRRVAHVPLLDLTTSRYAPHERLLTPGVQGLHQAVLEWLGVWFSSCLAGPAPSVEVMLSLPMGWLLCTGLGSALGLRGPPAHSVQPRPDPPGWYRPCIALQ